MAQTVVVAHTVTLMEPQELALQHLDGQYLPVIRAVKVAVPVITMLLAAEQVQAVMAVLVEVVTKDLIAALVVAAARE